MQPGSKAKKRLSPDTLALCFTAGPVGRSWQARRAVDLGLDRWPAVCVSWVTFASCMLLGALQSLAVAITCSYADFVLTGGRLWLQANRRGGRAPAGLLQLRARLAEQLRLIGWLAHLPAGCRWLLVWLAERLWYRFIRPGWLARLVGLASLAGLLHSRGSTPMLRAVSCFNVCCWRS